MLLKIPPNAPPEQIAYINSRLADIKHTAEREKYEGSLSEFVKGAWSSIDSSEYQDSWVVEAMCAHLEAVSSGQIKRLLINVPPRCSKPLSRDTMVLSKRGFVSLGEIVIGDVILTHQSRWRKVTAVHEQGELPVYNITTRSGREVEGAADHPFLTTEGWKRIEELSSGDVLALVPLHSGNEDCGTQTMPSEEARLLGYLIGDGDCKGTPGITCADDQEANDIIRCVEAVGFSPTDFKYAFTKTGKTLRRIAIKSKDRTQISTKKGSRGPVRLWMAKHDLEGKNSYTKLVPRDVMLGSSDVVRSFLGAYWACDGWVQSRGAKRDGTTDRDDLRAGCDSVNRALLVQIQHLLLRLGINSILKKKISKIKTKKQGDIYVSWNLTINSQDDMWRFSSQVTMYHEKYNRILGSRKRRFDFDRKLIGDVIKSIEPTGIKSCRCLTVNEDLSFTANGFAVHNTSIVSIMYPVWVWCRSEISYLSGPQVKFLCASYNQGLSLDSATKSRRLIGSLWFQKYWPDKIIFHADQNLKTDYSNTAGGVRKSTSVGSMLLGLGGDCLIADDLNKVEKDHVESDDERQAVKDFWSEFHSTRLNDPKRSAIINVQQRLHQSDVSGLILDSDEEWIHMCVPMRYDETRHCVTVKLPQYSDQEPWEDPRAYTGEQLMWPERFGEKEVYNLERELGIFMASGRLQQMPTPKGGAIIKRDWWQLWDKTEAQKYGLEWGGPGQHNDFPEFDLVVGSIDTAYKEKEENDYSAMTVWGIWVDRNKNRRAMMVYAWNKRLPLHGEVVTAEPGEAEVNYKQRKRDAMGLVELVAETCKKYGVKRLLIEDKARGSDIAAELRRLYARDNWGVELVLPVGDKISRGHSIVPMFTDGMVWAPNLRWADMVITQCALVPKSDHDDMYDTCLAADTGIVTSRGIVRIADIKCGDTVLTHLGRWRMVTRTGSRQSDHYYEMKAKGLEKVEITGEHPALVMRVRCPQNSSKEPLGISWKKVDELKARPTYTYNRKGKIVTSKKRVNHDALVIPRIKDVVGYRVDLADRWPGEVTFDEEKIYKIRKHSGTLSNDEYREIKELARIVEYKVVADIFGTSEGTVCQIHRGHIGPDRESPKVDESVRFIDLDEETGWVLGLFAAEGCVSKDRGQVKWACDKGALERVQAWIAKIFGRNVYVSDNGECFQVMLSSVLAAPLFMEFGYLAENKIVPQWAISAPLDFVKGFIQGYSHGDGHREGHRVTLTSTSRSLLWGVKVMLARLGIPSWGGVAKAAGVRDVLGRQSVCLASHYLMYADDGGSHAVVSDEYIGTHIEELRKVEAKTTVHNISVAEDESYVTVGGTVHNCTMFLHWARSNGILLRADEHEAILQDEMSWKPRSQSIAETYGV